MRDYIGAVAGVRMQAIQNRAGADLWQVAVTGMGAVLWMSGFTGMDWVWSANASRSTSLPPTGRPDHAGLRALAGDESGQAAPAARLRVWRIHEGRDAACGPIGT
jgi:hypothetical protein